jgi:hypothetical protein
VQYQLETDQHAIVIETSSPQQQGEHCFSQPQCLMVVSSGARNVIGDETGLSHSLERSVRALDDLKAGFHDAWWPM